MCSTFATHTLPASVAAALFALSELRRVSGVELLLAFVLGVEIECRIGGENESARVIPQ